MLYEKLKELIIFCDTITTQTLIKMVNDAGFNVGKNDMMFIEVVSVKHVDKTKATVYVLFMDNDRHSETYEEEAQIHFTWDNGVIKDLDFVQKFC